MLTFDPRNLRTNLPALSRIAKRGGARTVVSLRIMSVALGQLWPPGPTFTVASFFELHLLE